MLTAIVPIDLKVRAKDIIEKSINLAKEAEKNKVDIVFGHNDRGTKYDRALKKRLEKYAYSKLKSEYMASEKVNSSLLRNIAFEEVKTKLVLLLDVDIHPDFIFLLNYSNKLEKDKANFFIFPCLYLTKYGTEILNKKSVTVDELKNRFYNFSRKEFLHLASPSSITIMKTSDYRTLGGFDIRYEGHGYEDFDFLIRLKKLYKMNDEYEDFLNNRVARSPLFSVGFRKYLGESCLEFLLKKEMLFHLYHPKKTHDDYYISRKKNFERFALTHGSEVAISLQPDSTLINTFVTLCHERGVSVHDYSILFENKPGHIDRFDTLRRKLKFLFNF